jgi:hypothetical protein
MIKMSVGAGAAIRNDDAAPQGGLMLQAGDGAHPADGGDENLPEEGGTMAQRPLSPEPGRMHQQPLRS